MSQGETSKAGSMGGWACSALVIGNRVGSGGLQCHDPAGHHDRCGALRFLTAALLQFLAVQPETFKARERAPLVVIGAQAIFRGFLVLMAGIPLYTWRQWRNWVQGEVTF